MDARPMTPEQDIPEGYTAEEWEAMKRYAESLDFPIRPETSAWKRDLGVEIPEVEDTHRVTQSNGRFIKVRVPNKTYLIRCGDYVKIGITADVRLRLRTLEAHNPLPLEVGALFPGGREIERKLHARFVAYRHRDEWFRIEGELADWIKAGCPLG